MHRSEYLNLMLLKVKSLLNYVYDKIDAADGKDATHERYSRRVHSWKQKSPRHILNDVFTDLTYLKKTIKLRNHLENINEIEADFK